MTTSEMDASSSPMKEFLLTYLMPEKCYNYFFVDLNILHVPCLKIVLSKTCGVWILLGTVIAQLPQLWKVMRARSAEGLNLYSVLLQLYGNSGHVAYCIVHNFPISAWGETLFMLIQTMSIGWLILHYRGETIKGVLFLLTYGGLMFLLTSQHPSIISVIQASSILAIVASRVFQAGTNYWNGHTGQLSGLSMLLVLAGSLALIFTSLQETGSSLTTLTHVMAACLSCLLLAQVIFYRNSSASVKEKKK